MHQTVMDFVYKNLSTDEVRGKRVLEVGSYNVNGSVRSIIEPLCPASYLGIDMRDGPDVDLVCDISKRPAPGGFFDVVVCAEMLEHAEDWRACICNMRGSLAAGGVLLLTTRSRGFPLHEYPGDFWRFEKQDLERIFSDMEILASERDTLVPGAFIKVKPRPEEAWGTGPWMPLFMTEMEVYAMPGGR